MYLSNVSHRIQELRVVRRFEGIPFVLFQLGGILGQHRCVGGRCRGCVCRRGGEDCVSSCVSAIDRADRCQTVDVAVAVAVVEVVVDARKTAVGGFIQIAVVLQQLVAC